MALRHYANQPILPLRRRPNFLVNLRLTFVSRSSEQQCCVASLCFYNNQPQDKKQSLAYFHLVLCISPRVPGIGRLFKITTGAGTIRNLFWNSGENIYIKVSPNSYHSMCLLLILY